MGLRKIFSMQKGFKLFFLFKVGVLLVLLTALLLLRHHDPEPVERLRYLTFDYYNQILPRKPGNGVLIVDIDEESIKRIGQWPWPRSLVGDLPLTLKDMGAASVVFDIAFAEPDRTSPHRIASSLPDDPKLASVVETLKSMPDNDDVFARKIAKAGNVVMGFVGADKPTGHEPISKVQFFNEGIAADPLRFVQSTPYFAVSLQNLTEAAAGNGHFHLLPSNDGIIRRVPLMLGERDAAGKVTAMYPTLALEAVRVAMGKSIYKVTTYGERTAKGYGIHDVTVGNYTIPTDETGNTWVYYSGHRKDLYIPAWKILSREIDPSIIKDKIIFVGTSAIGLLDLRSTPLDNFLPGVEVHAELAEQILASKERKAQGLPGDGYLKRPESFDGAEKLVTATVGLLVIFIAPFVSTSVLAVFIGGLITGGGFGSLYLYKHLGYLIDPVYPSLSILTIFIVSSIMSNLRAEMEKHAVRKAFSHYISPVLMEELAKSPDKLKLGGEVRELSVMFTDIRNFTTISESMDPAELIHMMNDFLTPMTSAVLNNRGTVDKYMGDAMMAFWNAPLDDTDHARNACKTAIEMNHALSALNEELRRQATEQRRPFKELKAGIGIHTGKASVGNMGSKQRFAYSAIGDTVNLASRIEGQTKGYGVSIMITEAVRQKAPDYAVIELDLLTVKGRVMPERVYALLGTPEDASSPGFHVFSYQHGRMLAAYRGQQWEEAETLARECAALRKDLAGLYKLYEDRIAAYKANPPGPDWAGVWVAKDK